MTEERTFGEEVNSYLTGRMETDRHSGSRVKATQARLAEELSVVKETLNRKLKDPQKLTDDDIRLIGETLIWWGLITRRSKLQRLFDLADYTLPDEYWREEPWKSLPDDTIPFKQPDLLPLQNPSFEDWEHDRPVQWECNKKTGKIRRVPGRDAEKSKLWGLKTKGSSALEIIGDRDNREWVYCRTRETQELPVAPGSRIGLSFWAKKTQEGKDPERAKFVEVFYYDGSQWQHLFSPEVTHDGDWRQYTSEWWPLPTDAQKVAVGVVVRKDGAFQVDDIELRMRRDK